MGKQQVNNEEKNKVIEAAQVALKNAYAPYSKFRVGAAILTETGHIYTGCNIENVSLGLTICAERVAIFSAVAKEGGENLEIRAVAVVNEHGIECAPCGACRQVIAEFGRNSIVFFQGSSSIEEMEHSDLLPKPFESYE